MSTSGATNHSSPLSSGADYPQRGVGVEAVSLKLRERQRFFDEVFQQDMEIYLSTNHLHLHNKKPPVGSISSLEVNVDLLEQMDLMEISDHEALDVFLNSGNETGTISTTLTEEDEEEDELEDDEDKEVLFRPMRAESRSRTSSTSSNQDNSTSGRDTPIVQSDEEEVQVDNFLLTSTNLLDQDEEEEEEEEETTPGQSS
ncbi:dysbindin-like [Astyanax mexicanus]|nr:dysbindin-like [Astyanax mexicanus]